MFNYKSYADLSRDIAFNIQRIPVVDLVVGIPKSGMIPATMIASFRNYRLIDIESFVFSYALRSGVRRYGSTNTEKIRVIVVDDSVNTGHEFGRVRERLNAFDNDFEFTYLAVYGAVTGGHSDVADIVLETVPQPRFFQWNYRNHIVAESALFDMDGVLCLDPSEADNDDGLRYEEFISKAPVLSIPQKEISAIVTSRLEKWRPQTEAWLKENGVRYKELIMLDLPTAEERRRLRAHAPFKAQVYQSRDEILFVESNWKQAKAIAEISDKPVICTENDILIMGQQHLESLKRSGFDSLAISENAQLRVWLEQVTSRLYEVDGEVSDWLSSIGITPEKRARKQPAHFKRAQAISSSTKPPRIPRNYNLRAEGKQCFAVISVTTDIQKGAGAAASTARLIESLRSEGHHVETITLDDLGITTPNRSAMPLHGTTGAYWHSLHNKHHTAILHRKLSSINPDCVLLGAIDRGILSVLDLALLPYPIVWISRDNWAHTGGCLFKLEPEVVTEASQEIASPYLKSLTCEGYKSGCNDCPAINDIKERVKARAQYKLKELVYSYRKDIVFAPISSWLKDLMEDAPLLNGHQIRTCWNPVDVLAAEPVRMKRIRQDLRLNLGLEADKPTVLLASHSVTNERKGMSLALRAISDDPILREAQYVVMGLNSADLTGADIDIRHVGFVEGEEEKRRLYGAMDATLLPTLQESQSVVAADSICMGVPVVAFATSGPASFLEHKGTGYLATPFDTEDLARGLKWTLNHTNRSKSATRAREVAIERFSAKENISELLGAIEVAKLQFSELQEPSIDLMRLTEIVSDMQADQIQLYDRALRAKKSANHESGHLAKSMKIGVPANDVSSSDVSELLAKIEVLERKLKWNREKKRKYEKRFGKL